jgi:hypothetical protein
MSVDYCTLADVKSAMNISDSVDDTLLESTIGAASRLIDGYCGRDFTTASGTASRDFAPTGRYEYLLIDDVTAIVSVRIDDDLDYSFGTTLTTDDWQAEPLNSRSAGQSWPYTRLLPLEDGYWPLGRTGRRTVKVTGTFGWPAVPEPVRQAAILQSSRLFSRYDSPLGVAGFGELGVVRVGRLDPDVQMLLEPFRKIEFA